MRLTTDSNPILDAAAQVPSTDAGQTSSTPLGPGLQFISTNSPTDPVAPPAPMAVPSPQSVPHPMAPPSASLSDYL